MNPDRIRAAIRMLYPDEMTPTARNVLENILDDEELEAVADAAASSMRRDVVNTEIRNAQADALEDFAAFILRPKYEGLDAYTLEEAALEARHKAAALREEKP